MARSRTIQIIRFLKAAGPLPRRRRLPRQQQPDAIRLEYYKALLPFVAIAKRELDKVAPEILHILAVERRLQGKMDGKLPVIDISDTHNEDWLRKVPAEKADDWDESKHPRVPAGQAGGGQFGEGGGGASVAQGHPKQTHLYHEISTRTRHEQKLGAGDHASADKALKDIEARAKQILEERRAKEIEEAKDRNSNLHKEAARWLKHYTENPQKPDRWTTQEDIDKKLASFHPEAVEKNKIAELTAKSPESFNSSRHAPHENDRPIPAVVQATMEHFEKLGLGEVDRAQRTGWAHSSSHPAVMRVHASLQAQGVPGTVSYMAGEAGVPAKDQESFEAGAKDEKIRAYTREVYRLTQAELRAKGIKEVTVYRGLQTQNEVKPGDVNIKTRPISSWSTHPGVAQKFAFPYAGEDAAPDKDDHGVVVKATFPASMIYMTSRMSAIGSAGSEKEYVILGAESRPVSALSHEQTQKDKEAYWEEEQKGRKDAGWNPKNPGAGWQKNREQAEKAKQENIELARRAEAAARERAGRPVGASWLRAKTLIDQAAQRTADRFDPVELKEAARQYARRTEKFNKEQVDKQVKAALSVPLASIESPITDKLEGFAALNVDLIKTVHERYFDRIRQDVLEAFESGVRPETLADDFVERYGMAENDAMRIARDQIGKLNGELNQERQEQMGVSSFIWRTANDNRVRDSHEELEGEEFRWDDPPEDSQTGETIIPGSAIQCRCTAEPVFDDVLASIDA